MTLCPENIQVGYYLHHDDIFRNLSSGPLAAQRSRDSHGHTGPTSLKDMIYTIATAITAPLLNLKTRSLGLIIIIIIYRGMSEA